MNKTICLDGKRSITIVSADNIATAISETDAEMDVRAKEAVKSAINRAKACKKPVARYDKMNGKAYIETADGEKIYV